MSSCATGLCGAEIQRKTFYYIWSCAWYNRMGGITRRSIHLVTKLRLRHVDTALTSLGSTRHRMGKSSRRTHLRIRFSNGFMTCSSVTIRGPCAPSSSSAADSLCWRETTSRRFASGIADDICVGLGARRCAALQDKLAKKQGGAEWAVERKKQDGAQRALCGHVCGCVRCLSGRVLISFGKRSARQG